MTGSHNRNLKQVGSGGEALASRLLEGMGWKILAANYRCAAGEMDIIASEPTTAGDVLAFIEVKTRRGKSHGTPRAAVDERKQRKLVSIANTFLGERGAAGQEPQCRFDVIEVRIGPDGLAEVSLQRGAFTA